jgi:hypothetical protein
MGDLFVQEGRPFRVATAIRSGLNSLTESGIHTIMTLVSKIISGGQTGADRAALDAAIDLDIPHGGWVPLGRKAEDGAVAEKYRVQEMETDSYSARTEQNVVDADGTLILSHGQLTGNSALTERLAKKHGRPYLHIDLNKTNAFKAAQGINQWIQESGIKILNIAGPRASEDPEIYDHAYKVLKTAYHLSFVETGTHRRDLPKTVDEAVDRMVSELTLRDKARIARMGPEEAGALPISLGDYIWKRLGLRDGNDELMASCRLVADVDDLPKESAIDVIADALWNRLKQTHGLRPVK